MRRKGRARPGNSRGRRIPARKGLREEYRRSQLPCPDYGSRAIGIAASGGSSATTCFYLLMPLSTATDSPAAEGASAPAPTPAFQSTRLENLILAPDGVSFELEGRRVLLSAEEHPEDASAFQNFYAQVAGDLLARMAPPAQPPSKPGWLARVRAWVGRWFHPQRKEPSADPPLLSPSGPPAEAAPTSKPVRSAAKAATPATAAKGRTVRSAPTGAVASRDTDPPPPSPAQHAQAPAASQIRPPTVRKIEKRAAPVPEPAGHGDAPLLRAAYADASGVHLLWIVGIRGGAERETELIYPHDSEAGHLLQGCYEHLSRLGYPIKDLAPWATLPARESAAANASPTPSPGQATPSMLRGPESPRGPSVAPNPTPPKNPPATPERPGPGGVPPLAADATVKPAPASFVMKLHPPSSDHPGRAVVSPTEDASNLQVLLAPERLVQALHTAAEPSRPEADRITYLRCTVARGGLKIAAVGLGVNPDAPATPARWEELDAWWSAAQKRKDPEKDSAAPAPPRSAPAAPGPDPELF